MTERLLGAQPVPLVVLSAPAGYSKTTLLAEWDALDKRPFAWVLLTAGHDDPAELQDAVSKALQAKGIERGQRFVLVLDNAEALRSSSALEAVLDSLPAGGQLALGSRNEPRLPLGRLRARRQLLELGTEDLAMTRAESRELLKRIGVELNAAALGLLYERTEGWPAAVYLAGLSLGESEDPNAAVASFGGDDRAIVAYLRDELLSGLKPSKLRFLTHTSILDELSGPLCDAVLDSSGSARTLHDLARANFLIVPLDRTDTRYRYHRLLTGALRSELRRREPEAERELQARASRWYAERADPEPAIEHAIAAGDSDWAGELIWLAFPEMSGRGRMATVERWLTELGHDRITSSGRLALAAAHARLGLGQGERAAHWLRVAETAAGEEPEDAGPTRADFELLKATMAADGVVMMGDHAARASELHPADSPWQAPCYLYRGIAGHLTGHPERARALLHEAVQRGAVVSSLIQVLALSQLALIAADEEDWATTLGFAIQAREQVSRCGLTDYPSMAMSSALSALVSAREGQVERAQREVAETKRLLGLITEFPPWYEAQCRIVLAGACTRLDDTAGAEVLLSEASRFFARTPDATMLRQWLDDSAASLKAAFAEGRSVEWALTTAELRTLQYLPSHLSFREIGERIHVSSNTVKTQAQAVYRKLDASSRAEAVEHARSAGLLAESPAPDFMRNG